MLDDIVRLSVEIRTESNLPHLRCRPVTHSEIVSWFVFLHGIHFEKLQRRYGRQSSTTLQPRSLVKLQLVSGGFAGRTRSGKNHAACVISTGVCAVNNRARVKAF